MSTPVSRSILGLAAAANLLLIGLSGAAGSALAQGNPDGEQETPSAKPEAPNAYNLQGDTTNVGSASTVFSTTKTTISVEFNAWEFRANDTGDAITVKASGGRIGVSGEGNSRGVYGKSVAGYGVSGESSSSIGVYGESNSGYGVYGFGTSGIGVLGYSVNSVGVYGSSLNNNSVTAQGNAAGKAGVLAYNANTSAAGYGVRGYVASSSPASYGGYFSATNGIGLFASSNSNYAIYGTSTSKIGVFGASNSSYGVEGKSGSGTGVGGVSSSGAGVFGFSNSGHGVHGESSSDYGVYAKSTSGIGAYGFSSSNIGLYGQTGSGNYALYAVNPSKAPTKYAGFFEGNVRINGSYVATGTKSALVYTNQGERLMYAEESTMNRFSDEGTAMLKDGRAVIKIDPLFAQTVNLDEGYRVFVTPRTFDTPGLGVANHSSTSFEVRELNDGKGNFAFDWRISALRKGYENERMELAPAAPPLDEPADLNDMLDK